MVRTWFITGVNSGFGREMAEQLLGRGERVAGTMRRPDDIADLKAKYGTSFWTAQLDLTDTAAVADVVNHAFHDLGRIDVVLNNAGYGQFGAVEGLSDEQIARQIDTNLIGPIHVVRPALPYLRRQGSGRLIAMSSYGGQATHPGASLYHASKWGLEGFLTRLRPRLPPWHRRHDYRGRCRTHRIPDDGRNAAEHGRGRLPEHVCQRALNTP